MRPKVRWCGPDNTAPMFPALVIVACVLAATRGVAADPAALRPQATKANQAPRVSVLSAEKRRTRRAQPIP